MKDKYLSTKLFIHGSWVDSIKNETIDIYQRYSKKRDTWAMEAKEDREFRLGKQWTTEQADILKKRVLHCWNQMYKV